MQEVTYDEEQVKRVMTILEPSEELRCSLVSPYNMGTPAFQVLDSEGYFHKIILNENGIVKPIDCAKHVRGSKYEFCLKKERGSFREVRGLWIVDDMWRTMYVSSGRRKMWSDINSVKIEYIPEWATLIHVHSYGYDVFEKATKAPSIVLDEVVSHGRLHIYDFSPFSAYYEGYVNVWKPRKVVKGQLYNHELSFSTPVYFFDVIGGKLFVVTNETTLTLKSKDHGEKTVTLPVGVYLILHSPLRQHVV